MSTPKRKRRSPSLYIPPEFVSWLSNNYAVNPEESVPKDSIYRRYVQHCREMDVAPKKSNIFGKMLKKMFPNIRPRRLGSAGNMVAHYAGITLRQPGRPLLPSTPDASEHRRNKYAPTRHIHTRSSSCSSGASSPAFSSLPGSPISCPDEDDEDEDDECDDDGDFGLSSSEPSSPTSASSPTSSASCSIYPNKQQAFPTSETASTFSSQFSFYPPQQQPQQQQQIQPQQSQPPSAYFAPYAPATTFSYSSPNHHSFLSSLTNGDINLMDDSDDVFQLHTRVMEERETIEEEEFEEGDAAIGLMLNFPLEETTTTTTSTKKLEGDFTHLLINPIVKTEKEGKEEGEGITHSIKTEGEEEGEEEDGTLLQENSAQEREDIAMIESCLNQDSKSDQTTIVHSEQGRSTTVEEDEHESGVGMLHHQPSATQTIGVNPYDVVHMPPEMLLMKEAQDEHSEGNESDSHFVVPPCMRMPEQQQQSLPPGVSSTDYMNQMAHLKKYLCIFLRQIWIYAPINTQAMDDQSIEYYILTEEGRKEQTVRSLCVKFAAYMGALYCENFDHAKEFYLATRDNLSFVFDVLDLDVALVLLFLSQTANLWYEKEEADALAFNYISAAMSLCQAAKAFNTETYRKCVEYEGWLALRTGPPGQPPLRPYHPPPAHYKVVGKPSNNNNSNNNVQPLDSQMVLDDTVSILINVMNTLRFIELCSPSSDQTSSSSSKILGSSSASAASSPQTVRKTRRAATVPIPRSPASLPSGLPSLLPPQMKPEDDAKLQRLKENMRTLQKQLELCYNTICQVEASGGFSFEAAFRPKFWLISIVSSVHLVMGEREKGMNAAQLAVKSLEKWLSLSGSLWGCGTMFDYIAESLYKVEDDINLEFFVSLIEKQKYVAAKSTQAFVEKWRKKINKKESKINK